MFDVCLCTQLLYIGWQYQSFWIVSGCALQFFTLQNPSVRIINLVSHTTYVVCVNFIHKCRDLQFKVDSERQIFRETFHGNFILFTLRVFARNLLRGNRRRNTFRISFWCLTSDTNPGFASNKTTHYFLDHGEINYCL